MAGRYAIRVMLDSAINIKRLTKNTTMATHSECDGTDDDLDQVVLTYRIMGKHFRFYVESSGFFAGIAEDGVTSQEMRKTALAFIRVINKMQKTKVAPVKVRLIFTCRESKQCPHRTEKMPSILEDDA